MLSKKEKKKIVEKLVDDVLNADITQRPQAVGALIGFMNTDKKESIICDLNLKLQKETELAEFAKSSGAQDD